MATYASWRSTALAGGKAALSNITDATSATDVNGTDCDKAYWEANAYDQLYSMFTTLPTNPDKGVDGDLWVNYDATTNQDSKLVFQTNNNVSSTNPEILWDASETHFAFNNAIKVTGALQATGNITGTFAGSIASGATAVTQSTSNDSTAIATTAFVHDVVDTEDTISELNDTTISSPADGHLLLYNQQTSSWRNQSMDGDASISNTGTITLAASQSNITSLGTLTALQVDNVNINGSTISNSGGSILVEGTTFNGNDVTIAGNLTVEGSYAYLNISTLDVEDKHIQINKNSTTANAISAGISILGDSNSEVGYFKVGSTGYDHLLLFKAPTGEQFKVNATAAAETITVNGSLNIEADSNINQDVTTDASVSFGQLDVDNVRVSGNTISSTDTNGNIVFDPNGAGTVKIAFQNGTYMTIPNADGNNGQVLATSGAGTLSWVDASSSTLSALTDTTISSPSGANILIYDYQTSKWVNEPITGDISISTSGVVSIASGVIVNADISSSAAIADSKIATLTTANKVSGSAVQLSTHSAIENSSGLRLKSSIAGSGLSFSAGAGEQSVYVSSGGISTSMLADDAVTVDKIADDAVGTAQIADDAITAALIADGVIVNAAISGSASIADSKLATIATTNKVSGSAVQLSTHSAVENTSGLRVKSSIAGSGLSFSAGAGNQVLSIASGGVSTSMIADDAVTADKIADGVLPSAYNNWTLAVGGTSADVSSGQNVYFAAGSGLDINYETNVAGGSDKRITFSHEDTSSQASVNNSGTTYIQDITLDAYGHITGITSTDTAHSHSYLSTGGGTLSGMLTINADLNVNSSLLYAAAGYDKVGIGYTPSSANGGKLEVYGGSSWSASNESIAKFRAHGADAKIHINSTSGGSSKHKCYTIYEDQNSSQSYSTGQQYGIYKITTGTTLSGSERLKIDSSGNWTTKSAQFNVDTSTVNIDSTSGTRRLEIDSSGNFKFGEYTDGHDYDIIGNDDLRVRIYYHASGSSVYDKVSYHLWAPDAYQWTAGACSVVNAGSLDSHPGYNLRVHGTIGHGGISQVSDSRLKQNIESITGALDKVSQLQGVSYNWKDNEDLKFESPTPEKRLGLIAQDVEAIVPEVVNTGPDTIKALNSDGIIPLLIEAIKELKEEIETLKAGS